MINLQIKLAKNCKPMESVYNAEDANTIYRKQAKQILRLEMYCNIFINELSKHDQRIGELANQALKTIRQSDAERIGRE